MPQPCSRIDLSSSNPVARPSFSESSLPLSFSSAPQPILNQKLIPRDFLGNRSKSSPDTISNPQTGASKSLFSSNPSSSDRLTQRSEHSISPSVQIISRNEAFGPTEELPLDSNARRNNELKSPRTRLPESTKSPSSQIKARSASYGGLSIPDSNTFIGIIMPRTSSIDSAISNVSTTSLSKAAADVRDPSPASVRNLIATAGGAENLVTHLLKDKNGVASQNAQLWNLVEKQRALIFGLNKDLERITKERDRYRKRVKELDSYATNEDSEVRQQSDLLPKKGSSVGTTLATLDRRTTTSKQPVDAVRTNLNLNPAGGEILAHVRKVSGDQDKEHMAASQTTNSSVPQVNVEHPASPVLPLSESKGGIPSPTAPISNIVETSPLTDKSSKNFPSNRKAPPKPLNLAQGKGDGHTNKQVDEKREADEIGGELERGRRRTRAEDDRDREVSAMKAEAEARSHSKKNKLPKVFTNEENQTPAQTQNLAPLPTPGLPISPRPQHAQAFVAPSVHLTAANVPQPASINERLLAAPLKSPGLPLSPRPQNRNDHPSIALSLPLSPRANMGAFPLSPRAPKHALPAPTTLAAPADAAALNQKQSRSHQSSPQMTTSVPGDRLQVYQPVGSEPPPVYRGLAISAYPNLLLAPNALPSIQVKVHSSRLRPSRHHVLGIKNQEETTVFSLSVISRSSNSELWRIEKFPSALPQLEQHLRARCSNLPRMPDRKLFTGQSPSLLDERRVAIDNYFDELLDIHVDEQAAVIICGFLSTDVIDPEQQSRAASSSSLEPSIHGSSQGRGQARTGYLTKKGKNFGGWKSRFFILEGPEFRYYEAAGGPHLGTIRLHNALIGKQREGEITEDGEGQFRHAFLIQEPKRKDAGNYIRHVLCAESDAERDEWVNALLYWVEGGVTSRSGSRSEQSANASQEFNEIESSYQSSKAGPSSKDTRDTHINTPTPNSGSSIDSSILDHVGSVKHTKVSNPMNGEVITDASIWSHKPLNSPKDTRDKTYKMSNIFGFRRPDQAVTQQDQKPPKPRILRHNGYVRPVFGLPLAEAVEFCAPFTGEVDLPAVVYRCIEYLRYCGATNEEGLFRLSGSNVVVRNLKERFNTEGDIDLVREEEYHDVHAVASLFKTYLRELPSTLLTRELHIEFIKVLEMENNSDKVAAFNSLVHMLPPANFSLLKEMSKYLLEVTENADKNKMSIRNVGIVFSPTLNIPTPVFTLFLSEYAGIFETESNPTSGIRSTEITAPLELTPVEIRSPRHQMFSDLPTPAPHQTTFASHSAMSPPRGTMTGTGELGFMPINPIYESGNYVAIPRKAPVQPAKPLTQIPDAGGFSSLNSFLAPNAGPTEKAKKRHSQMYFSPADLKFP